MDALSDLLRVVRLKGGVFLHAEFTTPWCIFSQVTPQDCGPLLDGAEHMVPYHYVVEGRLTAQIPNKAPIEVEAGEVIIFPHNDGHLLGSDLNLPPVPSREVVCVSPESGLFVIRHGGGGARTRVVRPIGRQSSCSCAAAGVALRCPSGQCCVLDQEFVRVCRG
jgi:AraC family transcriptional regulator, alkane utilization regulator